MTDAGPSIFRNLESPAGRDSFDTIVRAAVAGFAALTHPSVSQARDFGRLVAPLFERTDPETRRIVAASLSTSPRMPRELVDLIIAQPIAVSAPFLLSSPVLTEEDLARLSKRREAGLRRLLKARAGEAVKPRQAKSADAAVSVATPADDAGSANPDAGQASPLDGEMPAGRGGWDAPPRRQSAPLPPLGSHPSSPQVGRSGQSETATVFPAQPRLSSARQTELLSAGEPVSAEPKLNADETREKLRQLVRLGSETAPQPADLDLLALAIARETEAFHLTLATTLVLDRAELAAIENDASGQELAVALKAAGFGTADALTALMMLKPAIGTDVVAFEAMERTYAALSATDCAARFGRARATHAPLYAETTSRIRTEPRRTTFGRRAAAPGAETRRRGEPR